jgi:hypothetical protein
LSASATSDIEEKVPTGGELTLFEAVDLLNLLEAELISGRIGEDGIDTVRITPQGAKALDPAPQDPLRTAQQLLNNGARVDAIVTAVELGLGSRLKEMATARDVPVKHADGGPIKLMKLNVELRNAAAYDETDRAQIEAWLKLRNDVAHPNGTTVSDARVAAVIQSIGVFLDEHA